MPEKNDKKLGFFKRTRKTIFLNSLSEKTIDNYFEQPDYIKYDLDVLDRVVSIDESIVARIPIQDIKDYLYSHTDLIKYIDDRKSIDILVKDNPENLRYLNTRVLAGIIERSPSLVEFLDDKNVNRLAYSLGDMTSKRFLRYLPLEKQQAMILGKRTVEIAKDIANFSPEAVIGAAKLDEAYFNLDVNRRLRNFRWLEKYDLKLLPIKTQVELLKVNYEYSNLVSNEAVIQSVGGNPLLYDVLSDEIKTEMVSADNRIFAKMPVKFQKEYLEEHPEFAKFTCMPGYFNKKAFDGSEDAIEDISKKGVGLSTEERKRITSDIEDTNYIISIGKYNPEYVYIREDSSFEEATGLLGIFVDIARRADKEGKLYRTLSGILAESKTNPDIIRQERNVINRGIKIASNADILYSVDGDVLGDFIRRPSRDTLMQIVGQTYGANSVKILEDKADLTDDNIPNYYVLHPKIVNVFGENDIYSFLYSKLPNSGLVSELARKSKLLEKYNDFCGLADRLFPKTPSGLNEKLSIFMESKELLENVDINLLSEAQKNNFMVAIIDRINYRHNTATNQELLSFPSNLEELSNYNNYRTKLLDSNIEERQNVNLIRNLISMKFFGADFQNHLDTNTTIDPNSIADLANSILGKEEEKKKHSQEEIDFFEICRILRSVNSVEQLRKISKAMEYGENQMNPLRFYEFQRNISNNYQAENIVQTRINDECLVTGKDDSGLIIFIKQQLGHYNEEVK